MPSVDEAKISNEARFLPSAQQRAQYRSFLAETWVTTKPQCLESLERLSEIVQQLRLGNGTDLEQAQAHQRAHKLVGTLGIFTLTLGMEIAHKIEKILNQMTLLTSTEAAILPILIDELSLEIEQFTINNNQFSHTSQTSTTPIPDLPFILFVDLDPSLTDSLTVMAKHRGFQDLTLSTIEAANYYLANIPAAPINLVSPTVILIRLSANQESNPTLDFIHHTHQRFPNWSILVLGERDELRDRLAVVRNGGKFLGTAELSTEQIFSAVTSLIQPAAVTAKVMVVDDDLDWLRALPQLLQPWGLKVTTLADPQQFWTVLQSVGPDALVLDLKMPEINGLELCQVLRSDPFWQRLPILFLSAANNPIAQQSAFSVGADDYLCKPMMGGELAGRIRHRLARVQAVT